MSTTDPREREEIDHEAEAIRLLEANPVGLCDGGEWGTAVATEALVHATLALVAIQREANEQARLANRIALARPVKLPGGGEVRHDIYKVEYGEIGDVVSVELDQEIAKALRIVPAPPLTNGS